jgi:hypothetical protein
MTWQRHWATEEGSQPGKRYLLSLRKQAAGNEVPTPVVAVRGGCRMPAKLLMR